MNPEGLRVNLDGSRVNLDGLRVNLDSFRVIPTAARGLFPSRLAGRTAAGAGP